MHIYIQRMGLRLVETVLAGAFPRCIYSACVCVYNCASFVELPSVDGVKIIIVNFITDKSRFYRVYCRSTITAALSRSPQSTVGSLLSSTPSDDASCCCCCSLSSPVDDDGD